MKNDHPRHRLERPYYLGFRSYFLTICTAGRRKLFRNVRLVEALTKAMRDQFCRTGFSVYAYCYMPDHCHLLAVAQAECCDLAKAVRAFKGASTARARPLAIRNLWQRNYYDHILRSNESFDAAAAYIFENPVRAGLVSDPHDWPFSGSCVFAWKDFRLPEVKFAPPWKNTV